MKGLDVIRIVLGWFVIGPGGVYRPHDDGGSVVVLYVVPAGSYDDKFFALRANSLLLSPHLNFDFFGNSLALWSFHRKIHGTKIRISAIIPTIMTAQLRISIAIPISHRYRIL